MLPETPWLVKCPHCGHLIWIDEAWQVGKKDPFGQSSRWPDALLTYEELNELEHLAALDTQLADTPKKIRYIRMRAWWQANDRFRETIPDRAADLSVQARSNMEALSNMLSESDENQRLMKAELARELGRFEEAERLLAFGYSNRVSTYVQRISELVKIRDARVAKL